MIDENEDWYVHMVSERARLYDLGVLHRSRGYAKDYSSVPGHNGTPLRIYKEAYDAGYDGVPRVPQEFRDVEAALDRLPTRPLEDGDF